VNAAESENIFMFDPVVLSKIKLLMKMKCDRMTDAADHSNHDNNFDSFKQLLCDGFHLSHP